MDGRMDVGPIDGNIDGRFVGDAVT